MNLVNKVRLWAKDRGIDKAESSKQFLKLAEECRELETAENRDELIDAIGDVQVVLIILCMQERIDYDLISTSASNAFYEMRGDECPTLVDSLGRIGEGIAKGNDDELEQGIINMLVNLKFESIYGSSAYDFDITPKECLEAAYNEISDRKGKTINGVFVKEDKVVNE